MTRDRLETLIDHWSDGSLSAEQSDELNTLLRSSGEARVRFNKAAELHGLLHAAANALVMESTALPMMPNLSQLSTTPTTAWAWRSLSGLILGIAIGIAGVSTVWALTSQHRAAFSRPVPTLSNDSFEDFSEPIVRGFPLQVGQWGGDEVSITKRKLSNLAAGEHALRFVTAMPDAGKPTSRAIACDAFQLVDLRESQIARSNDQDVVVELRASFLDDRPSNSQPSVTFFCQLYLFRGNPEDMHEQWPDAIREAVSSGSAQVTTIGDGIWRTLNARCLVPDQVDFAVVHLAARPNLRVPVPQGLFVDEVQLSAKTFPILPVRSR